MSKQISWAEGHRLIEKVGGEDHLALRITTERNRLGLSQEKLAEAMAKAGCPVPQSAISKIENPARGGRRAITVEEAITFAKVFGVPLGELLLPPDVVRDSAAWRRYLHAADLQNQIRRLKGDLEDEIFWIQPAVEASESLRHDLLAVREQVMRKRESELREVTERDGETWSPEVLDKYALPPAVTVVDLILGTEET